METNKNEISNQSNQRSNGKGKDLNKWKGVKEKAKESHVRMGDWVVGTESPTQKINGETYRATSFFRTRSCVVRVLFSEILMLS